MEGVRVQILDFTGTFLPRSEGVALRGDETAPHPKRPYLYYWGTLNGHRCVIYPRRRGRSDEPVPEQLAEDILNVFEEVLSR